MTFLLLLLRLSKLLLFLVTILETQCDSRSMLEQAFEMRSLIVMLDGIDEASACKEFSEG